MDRTNYRDNQQSNLNGQKFRKKNFNPNTKNGFAKTSVPSPKLSKVEKVFDNTLKLFIKNIPSEKEVVRMRLKELFGPCGEILHERFFIRRRGPNSTHSALIIFKTEAAVKKALELHGSLVEGRHIIVSSYAQYSANTNGVHIKNLSWDANEEDLWSLFEGTGKILFINIINPINFNVSNELLEGEVIFETAEEVKEALFFDNADICGLPITVSRISRETKCGVANLAVHVSGLPQDVTKEKVIQFFDKCGVVRLVKFNFKSLTAVVIFTSEEAVKAALELDGRLFDNNKLTVRQRKGEMLNMDLENPAYLYNIPERVRDVDIFLAFQECGYIIEVRFLQRKRGSSMKRAAIQFKYPDSVAKAIELDGLVLGGEPVSVSNSKTCFAWEEIHQDEAKRSSNSKSKKRKRNRSIASQITHQNEKRGRET